MSKQGRYIGIYDFLDNTPLDVANGGTGLTTVGTNNILTGNGTGAFTSESSLTWDGSDLIITSATSEKPKVLIENMMAKPLFYNFLKITLVRMMTTLV